MTPTEPITWDVIDSDSGEFFGRELSHDEAKALAAQLGKWARVVAHADATG